MKKAKRVYTSFTQYLFYAEFVLIMPLILVTISGFSFYFFQIDTSCPSIISPNFLGQSPYTLSAAVGGDIEFRDLLVNAAKRAFKSYFTYCLNYDELRPQSKECLSTFGFSASLFESLETLYLLNMSNLYSKARDQILYNFTLNDRDFINTHDFWSRGIGSLIGIYMLTGDKEYIVRAAQLADQILYIGNSNFVNVRKWKFFNYIGKNKEINVISDKLAGIPELYVLSRLINKPTYKNYINTKISQNKLQNYIYPLNKAKEVSYNSFTTSFIKNSFILAEIFQSEKKKSLTNIDFVKEAQKLNSTFDFDDGKHSLIDQTLASSILSLKEQFPSQLLQNIGNEDRFGNHEYMFGFHFKGDEILELAKRGKYDVVQKVITDSIERHRLDCGFSGTTTSSIGKHYTNNVQHTEFIGEWLKVGAIIVSAKGLLNGTIFNEHGHILKIK